MQADYLVHDRKYQEARANGWDGWGGNERLAGEHLWIERLFSFEGVPTTGRALELGCGEGHYARLLAQKGYDVVGVDISTTAIAWAKEKSVQAADDIVYMVQDLTMPHVLPGESFDLIADGNCLHCIIGQDRKIFLANVYRLLANDGVFFVSTLCSNTAEDKIVEFEGRPYRSAPTQQYLHQELEDIGFHIEKSVVQIGATVAHKDEGLNHCTLHARKSNS